MTFFYVLTVVLVGGILLVPLFFIEKRGLQIIVALLALICAGLSIPIANDQLYPTYYMWKFERQIKREPPYDIIAKHHPKAFADFIAAVKKNYKQTKDISETPQIAAKLVNEVFIQYLEKAPDEYIALYLKAMISLYEYLQTVDPRAVLSFEQGDGLYFSENMQKIAQEEKFKILLKRLLEAKRYLMEAALKTPMPIPKEEEAKPLINAILQKLADQYGEQVISSMFEKGKSKSSPELASKLIISFYQEMQRSGDEQAGIMMRYLANLKKEASVKAQNTKKE